jgi:hypothetical protein
MDLGQPDDVETPALGCLDLGEGLRERLGLRAALRRQKLVKDAEFHGLFLKPALSGCWTGSRKRYFYCAKKRRRTVADTENRSASPACAMHEADDAYMGYADRAELVAALNELLEAERAGARVTLESARAAGDSPIGKLMLTVERDEARWCGMLRRHLEGMGAPLSTEIGGFYGKAMAIADLGERVLFLNRGQGWVVRRLRQLLPRVRDDRLHADLAEMLCAHEVNIALANEVVGAPPRS